MQTHSDPELLLSYADKELSFSDAASVEAHLGGCGECRGELAQVRAAIHRYDVYHRDTLKPTVPAPPRAWPDLAFHVIDRHVQIAERHRKPSPNYRWVAIAAGVFLMFVLYQFSRQSRIDAEELLSKASAASDADRTPNRLIRIKMGQRSVTRQARMDRSDLAHEDETLRSLFQQANYSWQDPFSAKSFARWREQLPQKEDQVRKVGQTYQVRTTTSNGILQEASLTLTVSDLRPVQEALRFHDREWVEITEAPPTILPQTNAPRLPSIASESHPLEAAEIGPAEELRVLAALHRIGADLGEPIEVERNDKRHRIQVTGLGLDEARQAAVRSAVGALPGVDVRFVEPGVVAMPPVEARPAAGSSALAADLEQKLGRYKDVRGAMERILDQSDSSLVRAHALDKLARLFPRLVESGLAPPNKQVLTELWTTHIQAIEGSRKTLSTEITALLGPGPSTPGANVTCASWQECTPALLKASQDLDRVLTRSLTGSDGSAETWSSEVRSTFARWVLALQGFNSVPGR